MGKVQDLEDRIEELEDEVEELKGELLECQRKLEAGTNARWKDRNLYDERAQVRALLRQNASVTDAEISKAVNITTARAKKLRLRLGVKRPNKGRPKKA